MSFIRKNMWVNFDVRRQQRMNFHWRKRFYELQTNMQVGSGGLRLKTLMMVLLVTNMLHFASQDVNLWAGLEWITCGLLGCFIRCLDSHSDGTHSLQRIH